MWMSLDYPMARELFKDIFGVDDYEGFVCRKYLVESENYRIIPSEIGIIKEPDSEALESKTEDAN